MERGKWDNIIIKMEILRKHIGNKELHKVVFGQAGSIMQQAGIMPDTKINVTEIKRDDSSSVFKIENGDISYALKVFLNSENQFHTNIQFNQVALNNNIPTPKIKYSSIDGELLSAQWILWEWIDGNSLFNIESVSEKLNAAIKTGENLKKIHEIKITPKPLYDSSKTLNFFSTRIQKLNKQGNNVFTENELARILSATMESDELLSYDDPRLLHGDITGGNVIVDDERGITFIDPGEIIYGDPMSDLGYSQTTSLSLSFREGVWSGYTSTTPLAHEQCDRFLRWRLLRQAIITCRAVLNKNVNSETYIKDTISFLNEIG